MMNAFIRYVALNPYWNSPPDITARKLAPTILKEGRAYFTKRGYDLVDQFGPNAHVLDPMSVDWHAVAAGRVQVKLRQRPGPANSMGKMKFMFPNEQGIWLHDTPEKEKIEDAARLQSNGCVRLEDAPRFARWLFNGRPPQPEGREARAEGQPARAGAALHHLSDGGAERDLDRLFRRFLRQGPGAGAAVRGPASGLARLALARRTRAGAWTSVLRFSFLGASRARSNWLVELHAELDRLAPSVRRRAPGRRRRCRSSSSVPGATGCEHSTSAPIDEILRSFTSTVSPSMQAIARRISRWRGSRMQAKPSASTVDAVGKLRARSRPVARLPEDVALDHADAELADQLKVVVGLDALGAGIHAQRLGERDDGADDRRIAVGRLDAAPRTKLWSILILSNGAFFK